MSEHDRPRFGSALDEDMAEMEKVAAKKGKDGDLNAIELSRRLLLARGRRVGLALPRVVDLASFQDAQAEVLAQVAAEEITLRDALDYFELLEYRRRAIRTIDIEARIRAIEDQDDPPRSRPPGRRR